MRLSCNGCRVLRKGCSEGCTFRPCLQWIKSAEGQANATVFLAKFYGRAGLINLINAGPEHLRPAVFRSLLYEACGRIVNPIYGSVGLLWSGSWQLCQAAVEAVLKGAPITKISSDSAASAAPLPNFKAVADIRHVAKNPHDLRSVAAKSWPRFKRSAGRPSSALFRRAARREAEVESQENGSAVSGDTAEGSHVSQSEPEAAAPADVGLKLWFGPEPEGRKPKAEAEAEAEAEPKEEGTGAWAEDACRLELGLSSGAA